MAEESSAAGLLTVEHVRQAVASFGCQVRELPDDTSTAATAARALGTEVGAIVKSLLFLAGDEPLLVLASGDRRVDERKVRAVLGGGKVRMARPDEVRRVAGYEVGGVPPVGHRRTLPTLIDRTIMGYSTVYAAAGSPNAIFAVAPPVLVLMTDGTVADLVRE